MEHILNYYEKKLCTRNTALNTFQSGKELVKFKADSWVKFR